MRFFNQTIIVLVRAIIAKPLSDYCCRFVLVKHSMLLNLAAHPSGSFLCGGLGHFFLPSSS
jgi:hypothetical protein